MYQIHHNSRSFHFSFSTRNQLFFSFRHDKMNRKFLTHALIGGIYEHFRTDPAIRTHYHRILRKPPAAVLRCHRRRSSLDRSCRETVDAGKRKYLKRLHSGGRETPSDILAANSILYIETGSRSPYTVFHTLNGEFNSTESISKLEKKYSDIFLRVHASFMVNPLFVQSIHRFEITLTDGTVLPVPDRKYAKVTKALQEWGTSTSIH